MADTSTLILLRHGESEWNKKNLFTGWVDVDLTDKGESEARAAGHLLDEAGVLPDVAHTSLQRRAIRTVNLALETADRLWIPVRRSWRINERHYGGLTGLDKAETTKRHGEEQVHIWRRSYTTPPPPIAADQGHNPNDDPQYADLPPELIPDAECLADVVERVVPYWYDAIVPDLQAGKVVLVGAHGNSLRALVKHLDGIGDDEITGLNIPTGIPLVYELDHAMRPVAAQGAVAPLSGRYLDPDAAAAGAAAVAAQSKA